MVKTTINGTFRQTNLPNESEEYLSTREELRLAEIELRNQRERVAELRRNLPQGPAVQDYAFEEVAAGYVKFLNDYAPGYYETFSGNIAKTLPK